MYYAGIGSRDCPEDIGLIMTELARELEKGGWILRSGGAIGADTFFENGITDPANKKSLSIRQSPKPIDTIRQEASITQSFSQIGSEQCRLLQKFTPPGTSAI